MHLKIVNDIKKKESEIAILFLKHAVKSHTHTHAYQTLRPWSQFDCQNPVNLYKLSLLYLATRFFSSHLTAAGPSQAWIKTEDAEWVFPSVWY